MICIYIYIRYVYIYIYMCLWYIYIYIYLICIYIYICDMYIYIYLWYVNIIKYVWIYTSDTTLFVISDISNIWWISYWSDSSYVEREVGRPQQRLKKKNKHYPGITSQYNVISSKSFFPGKIEGNVEPKMRTAPQRQKIF